MPIVNREILRVVEAGADFIQIDEPSFSCRPEHPARFLDLVARTVEGANCYISMHMCFGNYRTERSAVDPTPKSSDIWAD